MAMEITILNSVYTRPQQLTADHTLPAAIQQCRQLSIIVPNVSEAF